VEKTQRIYYTISMKLYDDVRLKALFQLLKTEADAYGPVIKREIAAALKADPQQVQAVLEAEFQQNTPLSVVQTMEEICWDDLAPALAHFSAKINPNLEEGLLLLSKFIETATVPEDITHRLDEWARTLRAPLLNAKNHGEIATLLSSYFFHTLQIQTLSINRDIKELSFARMLRKKRGSNLCVACLYAVLGQRFGLDISLIDLAGRILVRLQGNSPQEDYFIDPLDQGKLLTETDCRQYIDARCLQWSGEFLAPLSSRQVVRRLLANMIFTLNKIHDERRLKYVRNYLEIIKN